MSRKRPSPQADSKLGLGKWRFLYDLRQLGFPSYSAYLKSEYWITLKGQYVAEFHPEHCALCDNPNFEFHHRTYVRIGQERLTDLVPLCATHHTAVHKLVGADMSPSNMSNAHIRLRHINTAPRAGRTR